MGHQLFALVKEKKHTNLFIFGMETSTSCLYRSAPIHKICHEGPV